MGRSRGSMIRAQINAHPQDKNVTVLSESIRQLLLLLQQWFGIPGKRIPGRRSRDRKLHARRVGVFTAAQIRPLELGFAPIVGVRISDVLLKMLAVHFGLGLQRESLVLIRYKLLDLGHGLVLRMNFNAWFTFKLNFKFLYMFLFSKWLALNAAH